MDYIVLIFLKICRLLKFYFVLFPEHGFERLGTKTYMHATDDAHWNTKAATQRHAKKQPTHAFVCTHTPVQYEADCSDGTRWRVLWLRVVCLRQAYHWCLVRESDHDSERSSCRMTHLHYTRNTEKHMYVLVFAKYAGRVLRYEMRHWYMFMHVNVMMTSSWWCAIGNLSLVCTIRCLWLCSDVLASLLNFSIACVRPSERVCVCIYTWIAGDASWYTPQGTLFLEEGKRQGTLSLCRCIFFFPLSSNSGQQQPSMSM